MSQSNPCRIVRVTRLELMEAFNKIHKCSLHELTHHRTPHDMNVIFMLGPTLYVISERINCAHELPVL